MNAPSSQDVKLLQTSLELIVSWGLLPWLVVNVTGQREIRMKSKFLQKLSRNYSTHSRDYCLLHLRPFGNGFHRLLHLNNLITTIIKNYFILDITALFLEHPEVSSSSSPNQLELDWLFEMFF